MISSFKVGLARKLTDTYANINTKKTHIENQFDEGSIIEEEEAREIITP